MPDMRDWLKQIETGERDPVAAARQSLRRDLPKRFYEQVAIVAGEGGCRILLDGKPVRTPGAKFLELPTEASAGLVAGEWRAVGERVDPAAMPFTRLANTAIDGVATDVQAVIEDILKFCASDLLCYRAGSPQGLVEAQARHWDAVLDWLRETLGAVFVLAEGVTHVVQPKPALTAFGARLNRFAAPFPATCLHAMTSLTGSAMLALAVAESRLTADAAWAAAHVDEDWNVARWGEDSEAKARRDYRWREMEAAARLLKALY
jgi:chaperone required for assembly of F1-ATPase